MCAGVAGLLVLVLLAVPALQRWAGSGTSVSRDRLRLAVVERADLVRDVSVQGRIVAAISPTLFAPAAGTISLRVDAGAEVGAGQTLAVLDSPELQNRLEQEQATLDSLRVELDRQRIETRQKALDNRKNIDLTRVTLVAADRERRRAESGHQIKAISEIDFEKTEDDLETARLAHEHAVEDAGLDTELNAQLARQRPQRLGDFRARLVLAAPALKALPASFEPWGWLVRRSRTHQRYSSPSPTNR